MNLSRRFKRKNTCLIISLIFSIASIGLIFYESFDTGNVSKARHWQKYFESVAVEYGDDLDKEYVNSLSEEERLKVITNDELKQSKELQSERMDANLRNLMSPALDIHDKEVYSKYNDMSQKGSIKFQQKTTKIRSKISKKKEGKSCKQQFIEKRNDISSEYAACTPHTSPEEACKFAEEVYKIDPALQKCRDDVIEDYCELVDKSKLTFSCMGVHKYELCEIGIFDHRIGNVGIRNVVIMTQLEKQLQKSAKFSLNQNNSFLFVQCRKDRKRESKTQMILLPFPKPTRAQNKLKAKLNINIVLLDSIARAHFYRSLPVVLKTFNEINKDAKTRTEILDFELFQSVHGHSAENFHAFFSGKLFPRTMTDSQKEESGVGIGNLYKKLQDAGYETMYQDDVCWKYWWGMRMELGSASNWGSFRKAIKDAKIDHTGLAFASCKILQENSLKTPFNGPKDSQICFNGKFQHHYIFEHLLEYFHEQESPHTKPRMSFTTINTAHDYLGLRIQTLNHDLAKFTRKLANMQNTLTILLADHGNTYTKYASTVLEGRFEMHHPVLFMILPEGVQSYFGRESMKALRINTKRLFTMIDLRKTVLAITNKGGGGHFPKERGLLAAIPSARQCNDLDLALPNMCVCNGWDSPAKNDAKQIGLLEFAVGTLNNMIQSQQKKDAKNGSLFWQCERLVAKSFTNIRERTLGIDLITTMDFTVKAGQGSGQDEDVFHVEVQSTIDPKDNSRQMKLLSYDRLSQYGIYRQCKDRTVNVKLCICSLEGSRSSKDIWKRDGLNFESMIHSMPRYRGIPAQLSLQQSAEENCVFILTRNFIDKKSERGNSIFAAVVDIINECSSQDFDVFLSIESSNCKTSSYLPEIHEVKSRTILFAVVIIREVWYWDSSYNIDAFISKRK